MPLSEDEQRILREIEDRLYESDPALANEVRTRTVHTAVLRRIRLAAVGMVVSLALTIFLLSVHFLLAFVGFLVTFALGAVIESGIRQLGQDGMVYRRSPPGSLDQRRRRRRQLRIARSLRTGQRSPHRSSSSTGC